MTKPKSKCYITSICTGGTAEKRRIRDLTSLLIKKSKSTGTLVEETIKRQNEFCIIKKAAPIIMPVSEIQDIIEIERNQNWPNWGSRNCIILGSLNKPLEQIDLFFLFDCNVDSANGDYDRFCQTLLTHYDWAFFSYFTSYHGGLIHFITKHEKLHRLVNEESHLKINERYDNPELGLSQLRSATFNDENGQWLLPISLVEQLNEPPPLFLCSIDLNDSHYEIYCQDKEEYLEGTIWFAEYTNKLKLVEEWIVNHPSHQSLYQLFSVTDLDAYNSIWAKLGSNSNIANCVFSANCNIALLKKHTKENFYLDYDTFKEEGNKLARWYYGNFYGGGSDEHHGIFYSDNASITDLFWQNIRQNKQTTIQDRLHSAIFYACEEECLLPLLLNDTEAPPLLLCQINNDEPYNIWTDEYYDYIENTTWYTDALNSLKLVEEFTIRNMTYKLLAISNEDAYRTLWTPPTLSNPIAQAVFYHDCDIKELKQSILEEEDYFLPASITFVSRWVYSKHYGGSFNYFYAKDKKDTQKFYALLNSFSGEAKNPQYSRF